MNLVKDKLMMKKRKNDEIEDFLSELEEYLSRQHEKFFQIIKESYEMLSNF